MALSSCPAGTSSQPVPSSPETMTSRELCMASSEAGLPWGPGLAWGRVGMGVGSETERGLGLGTGCNP